MRVHAITDVRVRAFIDVRAQYTYVRVHTIRDVRVQTFIDVRVYVRVHKPHL